MYCIIHTLTVNVALGLCNIETIAYRLQGYGVGDIHGVTMLPEEYTHRNQRHNALFLFENSLFHLVMKITNENVANICLFLEITCKNKFLYNK